MTIDKNDIKDSVFTHHFVDNELLFGSIGSIERHLSEQVGLQHHVPSFHGKRDDAAIAAYIKAFEETGDGKFAEEIFFQVHRELRN